MTRTRMGSLACGIFTDLFLQRGWGTASSYRAVIVGYSLLGALLAILFARLSPAVDDAGGGAGAPLSTLNTLSRPSILRVHRSRGIVFRLSAPFALDSFAGGLIVQSVLAWWFYRRFGLSPAILGAIFFAANILAGVSALAATWFARRIGLLNTMVFTHLPSNALLLLIPFMPTLPLAITVLLLRFSISQMDVPTRQAYLIAMVDPSERTAAAGITGAARATGAALAPILAVPLIGSAWHWLPFVAAGGLKIVYDIALLRSFKRHPVSD